MPEPDAFFRHVTPLGTEILVEPIPHVRSCAVGFWVRRGSCHEALHEEGLAHFIEHTVFKGTERFPDPESMSAATDRLGGSVDAFTGKEVACFYGKVLADQLPDLVTLLGELVTTPIFDGEELARERDVILEEIAQSEDQPDDWVTELFYEKFWKGGPLAHPILGKREQVASYGVRESQTFFSNTYTAPNLLITAAGAINPEHFMDLLRPMLDKLSKGRPAEKHAAHQISPFLLNENRKALQQTSLVMGFPAPFHRHPDRVAAGLLGYVLGGGMSSRLFMELRERHGLCYSVGSYLTHYADTGALQISLGCAPKQAREAVQRAMAECARVFDLGVSEDELERAKLQSRTSLVFSLESSNSRMFSLANQSLQQGRVRSIDQQLSEINQVTCEQVQRVAKEWLNPSTLGLAALGTKRGSEIRAKDLVA